VCVAAPLGIGLEAISEGRYALAFSGSRLSAP
jgi:hypothetical protein